MAARALALRIGPQSASICRAVSLGRRGATLAVLVEAWGAGSDRDAIQLEVTRRIAEGLEHASGSTTSRVKAGMLAAHRYLQELQSGRPDLVVLGAGASVLVVTESEVILAQAGPALAFRRGPSGVEQEPGAGPWLRRDVSSLSDDAIWPPLGLGSTLAVHWSHWPADPGSSVLLVPTAAAAALPLDSAQALLATSPARMKTALLETLGERTQAVHVTFVNTAPSEPKRTEANRDETTIAAVPAPAERDGSAIAVVPATTDRGEATEAAVPSPTDRGEATKPTAPSPTDRGEATEAAVPTPVERDHPVAPARAETLRASAEVAARLAAIRGARLSARVVRSMLPERTGEGAYRRERIRLVASACVAVPLLAIGLALGVRAVADIGWDRDGPPAPETSAGAQDTAIDADEPGTVRLAPLNAIALPGGADDERHLVAVRSEPYVMNVSASRVDVVDGPSVTKVLERGQVVDGDTVADLQDLFWLPNRDGSDGTVVALDAAGRLWSLVGGASRVPVSDQPAWYSVSRSAGYAGNLYVLDRSVGQILRYAGDEGHFPSLTTAGTPWLAEAASLAQAVDMAVDGSVIVLDADGSIRRFVQGQLDPSSRFDERTRSGDTRSVYTSPTAGRLLVADRAGGRVLVLAQDGSYTGQLLQPSQSHLADELIRDGRFMALQDVWWDEATGTVFLVDGNLLLQAPYK